MKFFQTSMGMSYPVDQIAWIGKAQEPKERFQLTHHTVEMTSGETVRITAWEKESICKSGMPIVPAEPNTELLVYHAAKGSDSENWWLQKVSIVAWRIDGDTSQPITVEAGLFGRQDYTAILMSTGEIFDDCGDRWSSIDSFEKAAKSWALADREKAETD